MKNYWKGFFVSGILMSILAGAAFIFTGVAIVAFDGYIQDSFFSRNFTETAFTVGVFISGIAGIICHRVLFKDFRTAILVLVWASSALLPLLLFLVPSEYDSIFVALIVVAFLTAREARKMRVSAIITFFAQLGFYFLTFLIIWELDYLQALIKSFF